MKYFSAWSIVLLQLLLTREIVSNEDDAHTFVNLISYFCPSPDRINYTTPEELEQDQDYRSVISGFTIPRFPGDHLFQLKHLTGTDILNTLDENHFLQNFCSEFVPIEAALVSYVQNRENCLFGISDNILMMVATFRTICETDFEETLKDVLETVGDTCIDSLFQNLLHDSLSLEDRKVCQETGAKIRDGDEPLLQFRKYFPEGVKNCILVRARKICGDDAETQFKRLSDRLIFGLFF